MAGEQKKSRLTPAQALDRARNYCSYQERCHQQVRDKLYDWGLHRQAVEEVIAELITADFLNEERFAKQFAGGKFRMKQWGRNKITAELNKRKISDYCIEKGIAEIDAEDYLTTLELLISRKQDSLKTENEYARKDRIARYCINKGYEPELVWDLLKQ